MPDRQEIATQAAAKIQTALIAGVLLLVGGGIVAGLNYHHTTVDGFGQATVHPGNTFLFFAGGVIALVGQLLVLLALIGYGVKWGTEAVTDPAPDTDARPVETAPDPESGQASP